MKRYQLNADYSIAFLGYAATYHILDGSSTSVSETLVEEDDYDDLQIIVEDNNGGQGGYDIEYYAGGNLIHSASLTTVTIVNFPILSYNDAFFRTGFSTYGEPMSLRTAIATFDNYEWQSSA